MEKNILEAFQPNIVERLGEIYWRDDGYRAALEREKEATERLKETLTENFCTLPFVLPAKSPPQAWQTLR